MAFDLYTDFIEPMYGEKTELLKAVTSLIQQLQENKVQFCFAGDLPFSLHCVRQMTTDLDIFISESNWHLVDVKLPYMNKNNTVKLNEDVITFGNKEKSFPFNLYLIKLSAPQWHELTVEHTLSVFRMHHLPVVAECGLTPMISILKSKRSFSSSEDCFFKARLKQVKEKRETGKVDTGYVLSWGELQALKKKRGF